MKKMFLLAAIVCSTLVAQTAQLKIPYTRHVLKNGLNLILHEDHSTPTVSVNLWFHVGSGHEKVGRTGFAHLFEHLMFEGSKNVAEGQFDRLLEAAGGGNNGSTNTDRTNYYEDVPSNALELALYLDSDRMGFLSDAMTLEKLNGQRDVVKNERRQSYENRPYGLSWEILAKNVYPAGHPYNWTTIGSMDDLSAASLEDVIEFFKIYYAPNNASLSIAGDINIPETIKLVEKWFGDIPAGKNVPPQNPATVKLYEEKILLHEDNVKLPRLYMAYITPKKFAPGDVEMDVLSSILTGGKNSRLYQKLVYELQIAQDVSSFQDSRKLSSNFMIVATARSGQTLEKIKNVIDEEIEKVKMEGPTLRELQRVVNQTEASFLDAIQTPLGFSGKANTLNEYFYYAGNPDYANEDLARYKALSVNDIQTASQTYLPKDARVILSIVPKGKTDLAVQQKAEAK